MSNKLSDFSSSVGNGCNETCTCRKNYLIIKIYQLKRIKIEYGFYIDSLYNIYESNSLP